MSEDIDTCRIRPVTAADARDIAGIYRYYVDETDVTFDTEAPDAAAMLAAIGEISRDWPWLVYDDGGVLGYCYIHPWKQRAAYGTTFEISVYVARDARGRGIGPALVERMLDICRADGRVCALIACITATNVASIMLFSSFGFRQVSHFRSVGRKHGRWLDVIDMELASGEWKIDISRIGEL